MRLSAPSFARIDATWNLTVWSLIGEALGDRLVGQALGDEVEYLALALGQILAEAVAGGASGRQSRPMLPTSPGSRATRPAATAWIAAPSSAAPAAGVR